MNLSKYILNNERNGEVLDREMRIIGTTNIHLIINDIQYNIEN